MLVGLSEIDETIENIYFNSTKANDKYASLEKAKTLIVCNGGKHQDFNNLLSLAKKYEASCRYVINSKHFDRAAYDYYCLLSHAEKKKIQTI